MDLDPIATPILISSLAAFISVLSLSFASYSWFQANRPLISARITTAPNGPGNVATALNLLIENTGNRPARDIRLIASRKTVLAALAPDRKNDIPYKPTI